MILGGKTIRDEIKSGNIVITNFDESRLNPNSYNLTLDNKLLVYGDSVKLVPLLDNSGVVKPYVIQHKHLDMKKKNNTQEIWIPKNGLLLEPGRVYLGTTVERTFTDKYVPMLEGRSSIGRLGLMIHVTAGFGDVGFDGKWTLEIVPVQPVIIYPNVEICQIYYHTVTDTSIKYTSNKYNNQNDVTASKLYKDFE
jgi:dCTP deaminase